MFKNKTIEIFNLLICKDRSSRNIKIYNKLYNYFAHAYHLIDEQLKLKIY